jgi:hypothetical protein
MFNGVYSSVVSGSVDGGTAATSARRSSLPPWRDEEAMGSLAGKDSSSGLIKRFAGLCFIGRAVRTWRAHLNLFFHAVKCCTKMGACTTRPHLYFTTALAALLRAADVFVAISRRIALLAVHLAALALATLALLGA